MLAEQHLLDSFDVGIGDSVEAVGAGGAVKLRIVGVVASPEYFWPARSRQEILPSPKSFGVLFVPEQTARELAGLGGPNQVAIYYDGGREDPALTASLGSHAAALGAGDVLTRADQPSNSALQQDVKSFQELAVLFPLLFLTAAALATWVLMRRLVTAERPTIGMLRACGYSSRQVVRHYLTYGVLTGLAGGVLGAAAGLALAGVVTDAYTEELSIPVTLVSLSPLTALAGIAFGLLTGALAAALPAASAARVPPAEAMRRFAPSGRGHLSLAERLLPPLRRAPVRWRMTLRAIGRNPRRSLSTILGVVLALTLILVSWGMVDTIQILVDRQYGEVERQDAEIYFRGALGREELRTRAKPPPAWRKQKRRSTCRSRSATASGATRPPSKASPATRRCTASSSPAAARRRCPPTASSPAKRWAASSASPPARRSGSPRRRPGSRRGRRSPPSSKSRSAPTSTRRWGRSASSPGRASGSATSPWSATSPVSTANEMRRRLSDLPGVVAYSDSGALREAVDEYLGLFYVFIGVMLIFGAAMAFALLYNSMQANLAERSVEVATLRAAGTPFRTLSRMITAENFLLTAIGIVPGLIIGVEVSRLFLASFSSDAFTFELQIRTSTLVFSALAILAVSLISERPGLRAVRRLDIARTVRERSA